MGDPLSSSVFAGINTAFKLAEFGLSLNEASEENLVFCRLIQRVRKDRAEAIRERGEKATTLDATPLKKEWIDEIINDTDAALFTIGKLVESGRADGEHGRSMTLRHRFEWVMGKKESFLSKQSLLATCHQSPSNAIVYMQQLPTTYSAPLSPSSPPSYWSADEQERAEFSFRSQSARRPKPKPEYVLPAHANESFVSGFSDDWEHAFTGKSDREDSREQHESTRDEDSNGLVLDAAVAAVRDVGKNGGIVVSVLESPWSPSMHERRRRNEARFRSI